MFAEIGLLVLEGDAAGLAAKVSELSAASLAHAAPEPGPMTPPRPDWHPARSVRQSGASAPLVHSRDS